MKYIYIYIYYILYMSYKKKMKIEISEINLYKLKRNIFLQETVKDMKIEYKNTKDIEFIKTELINRWNKFKKESVIKILN